MRYLIYDSSIRRVKLLREIEMLESYIELQLLKYDENKNVDFYYEGIKNQHRIAPQLLISFLENTFKHGDLATNPEGWISVSACIEGESDLSICFCNSYRPQSGRRAEAGRIGLKNAHRQLELNYPGRHRLKIEKGNHEYRVDLRVELGAGQE